MTSGHLRLHVGAYLLCTGPQIGKHDIFGRRIGTDGFLAFRTRVEGRFVAIYFEGQSSFQQNGKPVGKTY
jgi:hypothetical protein